MNSMSLTVVHSLMDCYNVSYNDIGLLEVGTETTEDCETVLMTLMNLLVNYGNCELEGSTSSRGILALYHALHWVDSYSWNGQFALVVIVDNASSLDVLDRSRSGSGAVAMLIGRDAPLPVDLRSKITHAMTFNKADGVCDPNSKEYERFYLEGLGCCYNRFVDKFMCHEGDVDPSEAVDYFIFDCPRIELWRKFSDILARTHNSRFFQGSSDPPTYGVNKAETEFIHLNDWYEKKVLPSSLLTRCIGGTNTASLYFNLAYLVSHSTASIIGKKIILYSYDAGVASMISSSTRRTENNFTLERIQDCLDMPRRLSCRLLCCHEVKRLAFFCNETSRLCVPYEPKFPLSHLRNNTYYLKSITCTNGRVYERLHRQISGMDVNIEQKDISLLESTIKNIKILMNTEENLPTDHCAQIVNRGHGLLDTSNVKTAGQPDDCGLMKNLKRSKTYIWASGRPNLNVVVTGVAAALPGRYSSVFKPGVDSIQRIITGENFITELPENIKVDMLDKNVVQLRKNEDGTTSRMQINTFAEGINLCASIGEFDLTAYGVSASIVNTMDRSVQVAVAAGLEALKDAGIVTGMGEGLSGWVLPQNLQNSTGVVYATSYPALDAAIEEVSKYFMTKSIDAKTVLQIVTSLRDRLSCGLDGSSLSLEVDKALIDLQNFFVSTSNESLSRYEFDRKFLFRVLVLGNAQLAQIVKARGPNMQTNAACAGATQAVALAYDMIQIGRAERMIIIAGDNASSDNLMPWLGNGFRALGAATSCANVRMAALPFDKRRTGMILGSGGIGMILESEEGAKRRHFHHLNPRRSLPSRCRLLGTLISNSAYHGASMDMKHISQEMERFLGSIEREYGIDRRYIYMAKLSFILLYYV